MNACSNEIQVVLGNKIDVEENKRVVSQSDHVPDELYLQGLDFSETCNDILSIKRANPILRDKCKGSNQRGTGF